MSNFVQIEFPHSYETEAHIFFLGVWWISVLFIVSSPRLLSPISKFELFCQFWIMFESVCYIEEKSFYRTVYEI
jgi:hypothetical protein